MNEALQYKHKKSWGSACLDMEASFNNAHTLSVNTGLCMQWYVQGLNRRLLARALFALAQLLQVQKNLILETVHPFYLHLNLHCYCSRVLHFSSQQSKPFYGLCHHLITLLLPGFQIPQWASSYQGHLLLVIIVQYAIYSIRTLRSIYHLIICLLFPKLPFGSNHLQVSSKLLGHLHPPGKKRDKRDYLILLEYLNRTRGPEWFSSLKYFLLG